MLEKRRIIDNVAAVFQNVQAITLGYLYGSIAAGHNTPLSDIDLAFLGKNTTEDEAVHLTKKLTNEISESLDSLKVDLVCLNFSDLQLRYSIVSSGILIFERDSVARVRFERETVTEYIDMVPLWDYYDRHMHERIRRGEFGD